MLGIYLQGLQFLHVNLILNLLHAKWKRTRNEQSIIAMHIDSYVVQQATLKVSLDLSDICK
jgi:hypothetical protein